MKKARSSKSRGRTKGRNSQRLALDAEAVNIMRTVKDQEAFYFYEAVGRPTGEIAKNLSDFLGKLRSVKSESVMFHLERGDFQNWIEKTLGDSKLAGELGGIPASNSKDVKTSICRIVENRIKELRESSATQLVDENSTVLLPSSFLSAS